MPRSINQKLLKKVVIYYAMCSYVLHPATKEKVLANAHLTPTTAVYVIPCKYSAWHNEQNGFHKTRACSNGITSRPMKY